MAGVMARYTRKCPNPHGRIDMSVFKKQGVFWIDYYVNDRRKRKRIRRDRRMAGGGETEALVRFRGQVFQRVVRFDDHEIAL
jgi:hypothetical protein